MAKWGAEAEPLLYSYAQLDYSDGWAHFNVSASSAEVNVTITDPGATMRGGPTNDHTPAVVGSGAATGVWGARHVLGYSADVFGGFLVAIFCYVPPK